MGNKARRGKTQPRSTGGQETAPSLQRPGGLQGMRSRTAGRGSHTLRAPPAASLSAALSSAQPRAVRGAGDPRGSPALRARQAERRRCGASSRCREGAAAPACTAGRGCRQRLARAGRHPPPERSPFSAPILEPAVRAVSASAPRLRGHEQGRHRGPASAAINRQLPAGGRGAGARGCCGAGWEA